ncbi:sodium:solute symporter [Pseudoxanthomonas sp. UTMC 1351]|uniref:sodium:solute symporter n=1 Tax=Pseudoxanthomonas sp. UTMC 1351 TaxID=2695853 RepID=UPI0034CD5EC8
MLVTPAAAQNLSSVRTGTLPALETDTPLTSLANVDGVPVAVTPTQVWLLADKSWRPASWQRQQKNETIKGISGDGQRAYLLLGSGVDGAVKSISRVQVERGSLKTTDLPALPSPLAQVRMTTLGEATYLSGRNPEGRAQLFRLDTGPSGNAWAAVAGWPSGGAASTLVAQKGSLFVTVPDSTVQGERLWRWSADGGWQSQPPVTGRVMPGSARSVGQAHVLYLVERAPNAAPALMTFHSITSAWAAMPDAQAANATVAAAWGNGLLWAVPGGNPSQMEFRYAELESGKYLLKWLDWVVIVLYLAAMVGIGLYFYLHEKRNSTSDFFVGGRSIPFWAAGVSLYATNTSSISFIAIPAKAFETNWQYLTNNLIAILGLMFVAIWIVPLLRRLDLMSVFSYLETRFHPAIRMLASALCILMQIGSRMSIILFLPSLAIATITGIDVVWSIMIMGVFTIIYTTLGGMKAVIWTDFVQVFVMFGGAIFAIGFIIYNLNGGVPEFLTTALAEDKMKVLDFSFDLTKATVWGFIFLVVFDVVLTFPKDQVLMQRVLSTKSDKEAGRSIWTFAAIMIPGGFFFYMIGTALFVYYKTHPERMNPLLPIDATFPLFIAAELPMGVTGLIIAGIFAAAMSTLSSIINSVSTLVSVDFYEKLAKNPTPKKSVLFAEIMGVLVGLFGIGIALLLSRYDIHSLFDVSIELAGLLGGGFAGAYTLGMFTRRANSPGVAIGIGSSIVLTTLAWSVNLVHPYFYLAISILLCIVIGYGASLLFPAPRRSLDGLTIYRDIGPRPAIIPSPGSD